MDAFRYNGRGAAEFLAAMEAPPARGEKPVDRATKEKLVKIYDLWTQYDKYFARMRTANMLLVGVEHEMTCSTDHKHTKNEHYAAARHRLREARDKRDRSFQLFHRAETKLVRAMEKLGFDPLPVS